MKGRSGRSYTIELQEGGHEEWDDIAGYDFSGGTLALYREREDLPLAKSADHSPSASFYKLVIAYPPTVWRSMWEG